MPVSAVQAAKKLCEERAWMLSNMELQKILYIAHMFHMGRGNGELIRENFEAWDFGPVVPVVYHKVKAFGRGAIRNIFSAIPDVQEGSEADILKEASEGLKDFGPSQLVAITHWSEGAWARHYEPGVRGVIIPNDDIRAEYESRERAE